jgi:predicted AlkP superfamily phosphohydrolase/phosphomutase
VFATITATDRACHAFFRHRDRGHPEHDPDARFASEDPILVVYRHMDETVGQVRAQLEPDDVLLVCSDHGFQTWRWEVNVNQWLVDEGYLALTDDADAKDLRGFFQGARAPDGVDWSRTRAFALGLGQIYVNLAGRDPQGVVAPAGKRALMEEIKRKLEALENPYLRAEDRRDAVPARAVREVTILEDAWDFGGPAPAHAPDMQIGFARGYRISWQTALLGGMKARGDVFAENRMPWSGDHCSTHPDLVPGILMINRKVPQAPPERPYHVRDVAATVLAHFGLDRAHLHGESRPLPMAPADAAR